MVEFGFALILFVLAFAGLALGVLNGRAELKGSCGGLNQIPGLHADCGGACSRGQICPNQAEHAQTPTRSGDLA
ncbi:(Na+)-NQR maturation NqrM [Halochromatium roseum]|uniref:(Na+)-NQR maturation NqrM n=1 Tax=Halochromatium roseum TaxID=391920 RepID=UPI001914A2CC|nr:(Na+)-NQR maturation NqrM [Halochromatium roseum]MBK5939375.1 hypothetical protein [Halochromatium roseum]